MKIFFLLEEILLLTASPFGVKWTKIAPFISQKSVSIILPADGWLLNFLTTGDNGRFQATLWALLSGS
jgi:hypothetical protein